MPNHRNTVQRQIIHNALVNQDNHPTVDELYLQILKNHPTISKTTVYRNLRILAQSGLARKILTPDGIERYDKNTNHHYHFKCQLCDGIFDISIPLKQNLDSIVSKEYNFDVFGHEMVFTGQCHLCKEL